MADDPAMPERPLPEGLTGLLREPERKPTPEETFRAYLAREEAAGEMERPRLTRAERWRANAEFCLALAGVIAVSAGIAWWKSPR